MEAVVARENLLKAYQQVVSNKGAAGVAEMSVEQLKPYLQEHWATVKESLLQGTYQPAAVRCVEIPQPNGGVQQLGIPTVLDRLIQQALHQGLSPIFAKIRTILRETTVIKELNQLLRGWLNYFRLAAVKGIFEELDGWLRRRLCGILWRQWKRPFTRAKNLMKRGLEKLRAWKSATNGHGP